MTTELDPTTPQDACAEARFDRKAFLSRAAKVGAVTAAGGVAAIAGASPASANHGDPVVHLAGAETITGVKTFAADALFKGGIPWYDVKAFGAVGDGVADDTAAIQAAIDAVPAQGGTVHIPVGVYRITSSIRLKCNLTIRGTWGGRLDGGTSGNGSLLKWDGPVNSVAVLLVGTEYVVWDGVSVWGQNIAGLVAFRIQSDNLPPIHDMSFRNFNIEDVPGIGIQVGTVPGPQQQDSVRFERFRMINVGTGFEVNTANALDCSTMTDGDIQFTTYGFHGKITKGIALQGIRMTTTNPAGVCFRIEEHAMMVVESCSFTTPGRAIVVDGFQGQTNAPLTLIGNHVDGEVHINMVLQPVTTMGNSFLKNVYLNGVASLLVSTGDQLAPGASFQRVGSGAHVLVTTPNDTAPVFEFVSNLEGIIARFAAQGPNSNPGISIENLGSGGSTWQLLAPGATGSHPGSFVLKNPTTGQTPVVVGPAAPSGSLNVLPNGVVHFANGFAVPQTPALTPGVVIGKVAVHDGTGAIVGWAPVYDAIL